MPKCPAITAKGKPCPTTCAVVTMKGKKYKLKSCVMHAPLAIRKELGVVNPPGKGRKKHPHPLDILRERFEAEADRYLQTFEEALTAVKPVVVGNGASAHIEYAEDFALQLKALNDVLDRIYGRPKQVTELSGRDGAPMAVEVPTDDQRKRELAAILANAGALGSLTAIPQNASASAPTTN